MRQPPINDDEVYIRCPGCGLIGWTVDDDSRPLPLCPSCDVRAENVGRDYALIEGGRPHVVLIDGAPTDPSHHLTEMGEAS